MRVWWSDDDPSGDPNGGGGVIEHQLVKQKEKIFIDALTNVSSVTT